MTWEGRGLQATPVPEGSRKHTRREQSCESRVSDEQSDERSNGNGRYQGEVGHDGGEHVDMSH